MLFAQPVVNQGATMLCRVMLVVWVMVCVVGCSGAGGEGGEPAEASPGASLSDTDCAIIQAIDGRQDDPVANAVAFVFSVTTCSGEPVIGLTTEDFEVYEDDEPIVRSEADAIILDRTADAFVTLILDNSPSVAAANGVEAVTAAAIRYAEKVMEDASVKVGVYFFSKKHELKLAHTTDKDAVIAALTSYQSDTTGSNTTNLYGSLIAVLNEVQAIQSDYRAQQRDGVILLGQTLMFTDGADLAAVASLEEAQAAVAQSSERVTLVAFGQDADPQVLDSLSTNESYLSVDPDGLGAIFEQAGDRALVERKSIYVLGYCSPKLAGTHTVKVAIPGRGVSPTLTFNADGWLDWGGEQCSAEAFGGACAGSECGGLYCGGCPVGASCGQDGKCSVTCVPDCSSRTCGDDGCGGSCGSCPSATTCDAGGNCCQPACAGKTCGDDGCGGSCGVCDENESCTYGLCRVYSNCEPLVGGVAPIQGEEEEEWVYLVPMITSQGKPASIRFEFFSSSTGSFALNSLVNQNYKTCEQCVLLMEYDSFQGQDVVARHFQAAGVMHITPTSQPRLGSIELIVEGLRLVEVNLESDLETTIVPNGKCYFFPDDVSISTF